MRMRIGHGFDTHALMPGRPLVLGGIVIPHDRGLEGHSDGDVLLHALMDAMLGAAGAGDIGQHFPPGDPRFAGADSRDLLREVVRIVAARGFALENCDLTLVAEVPRIAAHRDAICESIAFALGIDRARVNLKATTAEGLGALGRSEGIAAQAIVLLREVDSA